jgi:hypothetical protein
VVAVVRGLRVVVVVRFDFVDDLPVDLPADLPVDFADEDFVFASVGETRVLTFTFVLDPFAAPVFVD